MDVTFSVGVLVRGMGFTGIEWDGNLMGFFWGVQRSKARDGSFERDGYNFWHMYGEPKHKREQKPDAEESKS